MIIGKRLKGILKYYGITAKSFSKMVGVTEGMVYKYYKMDNVDSSTIDKWSAVLNVPIMSFMDDDMYERATHKTTKEEIEAAGKIFVDLSHTSKGVIEEDSDKANPKISYTKGVPYYNVDFIGGFDLVLNDQTVAPEYLIDFQKYNEATCWCNVTGHSMEPEINHGDIIALKIIEDKSFLPFGEVYAIVTTNDMRTIKRLGPAKTPDCYLLVPTNKSPEYGVQEIPKDKILYIFQVLGCMKRL